MVWGISRVEHETAVQQKLTERYLLNELDADARSEFEEHFFDCPECAFDVQAGVAFIDHSKSVLDKSREKELVAIRPPGPGWLAWLRPAFAAPALALLLAVVGYQNLVIYPRLQQAQVLPWASVI
jgi:anti-sigma factor RsiW